MTPTLQPSALLSVWATGDTDAWVVGGHDTTNTGPIVAHYDGSGWTKIATGLPGTTDIWWVKGFDGGPVFISGSQDTIAMSTDGTTFTPMTTPPGSAIVFGLWGATPEDMWAVGGTGAGGAFVWHYQGSAWTAQTIPASVAPDALTCWKVNGDSASNVWISCTNGVLLHWNGSSLVPSTISDATQQQASLFSIGVTGQRVITVGGATTGLLYESTDGGQSWQTPLANISVLLSGVSVSDTDAYAVGGGGTIVHQSGSGAWTPETSGTIEALHAVFIDPTGAVWAVGGAFDQQPTMDGVLLHAGTTPLKGSFP